MAAAGVEAGSDADGQRHAVSRMPCGEIWRYFCWAPAPKKRASNIAGPHRFQFHRIYFVQVSLIIFTSVTLKLAIASLLDAFST